MIRFLLIYLLIYPLVHYYLYRKAMGAFLPGRKARAAMALFMAVMVAAPVMVRLAERNGIETGARFWAWTSFSWMGLLFLFLMLAGAIDLIRLAFQGAGKILPLPFTPRISLRQLFVIETMAVLAVYSFSLFEAGDIRQEHIEIASPKIREHPGRLRIAQISDVHVGLLIREKRLNAILAALRQANPDIVVSTGDLVDGQLNHLSGEARLLATLAPPLGKFAITGNHEFYAGLPDALAFSEAAGFTILRQQGVTVGGINLVGVDDQTGKEFGAQLEPSERDLLVAQPGDNFTVLLKHRPAIAPDSLGLFDLQLSGHTHKGQVFPFNLITWLFYPQRAGRLTQLESGYLYLSRGTGTWGPPIRFLAPPEVTIIDLVHEKPAPE